MDPYSHLPRVIYCVAGIGMHGSSLSLWDPDTDSFSLYVLRFELSGPECENFSVIDLPGMFRSEPPAPLRISILIITTDATLGQTSKEDMGLVRGMTTKYLSNLWSIILSVTRSHPSWYYLTVPEGCCPRQCRYRYPGNHSDGRGCRSFRSEDLGGFSPIPT